MGGNTRSPADNEKIPQRLLDSITDYAICMLDPDGFILTWNPGAERLSGYMREEVVGAHFSRLFTEEDKVAGLPQLALATARRTGRFEAEAWRVRRDGTHFLASAVIDVVKDDEGRIVGFAEITRDITERHAAQQALLDSERRFRLLVEGITDYAIYMMDPSGVITNWNSGAQRIKGYTADEIIGRHFSIFFPAEDRRNGVPMRNLEHALKDGRFESEGRRVRKDGSEFWAHVVVDPIRDSDGALIGFAKITRDITERQAAQHALRDSERQFALLVAGVTDYAIYMLDRNGVITSWNAGAEKIKGYTADEVIGRHFSIFYTDADRRAGKPARALQTALEAGKFEAENWRCRKDGSLFFAHVIIDPIRNEDGELIGFAKITRDISERREAEAALDRAQSQLAQAHKMEALGQLTGGVAHDFNNLLMVVMGQTQMLRRRLKDNSDATPALNAIELAAKRGSDLTRQLLAFARRQPSNAEVVPFKEQLEAFRVMLINALPNGYELNISAPQELWPLWVDVSELELALLNLTVNARDAMAGGGVISVIAENARVSKGELRDDLQGDFVVITVADAGHGIPADIMPNIFDPFFTTKETGKGSGLGLAQVFGFVRHSGGDLKVHSEVGKGTRVSLYLPRAARDATPAVKDPVLLERPGGGGSILVVEDNPDVMEVTKSYLEQLGYTASTCSSGDAALAAVEGGGTFDLVLSDIIMPGPVNGLGLARRLRETHPELPVLLVTGFSNAAEQAGDDFPTLRKPFEIAELARAISNVLSTRRGAGEGANVVPLKQRRSDKKD